MSKSDKPGNYVFDIKDKITTGSFGSIIYKAYDESFGQVAIAKKYPSNKCDDYQRFMKTLDDIRENNVFNVVKLYGYYKATKNFWVVMEHCHGRSIYDLMQSLDRSLKESQIRSVVLNVLKGLEALHKLGIVHTRIKTRNILVTTFGVCKLSEPGPPSLSTETGAHLDRIVGNAYWTAPEVLQQEDYTAAADIWSLGITIIEMGERYPPYADTHPTRVMVTIPSRNPPTFLHPDIWSKSLRIFLSACLQMNPSSRQDATKLLAHKIIKKAEQKALNTMVQKSIKVLQNTRFYTESPSTSTASYSRQQVSDREVDDEKWAESGTLIWKEKQTRAPVATPTNYTYNSDTIKAAPSTAKPSNSKTPVVSAVASTASATRHVIGAKADPVSPPQEQPSTYNSDTVTLNTVNDYTPSYMQFYKDMSPKVVDQEPALTSPCGGSGGDSDGLFRRNSIDKRGMNNEKVEEEFQNQLKKLDHDYCMELEEIRNVYIKKMEALCYQLSASPTIVKDIQLDFYGKLKKPELMIMLRFQEEQFEYRNKQIREYFGIQHQILMGALQNVTSLDDETEYNIRITQNNELLARSLSDLNRDYNFIQDSILKCLEKIDFADAVATE